MNSIKNWREDFSLNKTHYIFLFFALVAGLALRIYFLSQPANYDEAYTFYYDAMRPLSWGLSDYTYPNNHLFHTFLTHFAYLIGGSNIIILRMPAFIAGILLIVSIYIFARLLLGRQIALMATVLAATSSYLIEYSTNARGYSIVSLLFVWLLIAVYFIKYGNEKYQLHFWALFVIFSFLGIYTIPTMLYPLIIVLAWLGKDSLTSPKKFFGSKLFKRILISLFLIFALSFLLYLPVLLNSGVSALTGNDFVKPQQLRNLISGWPQMLRGIWNGWSYNWTGGLAILIFSGFLIFYIFIFYKIFYKKEASAHLHDSGFLALSTPPLLFLLLFLQKVAPPPRVFIFAYCLFIIFSAGGLNYFLKFIFDKCAVKYRVAPLINYGLISIILTVPAAYLLAGGESLLPTEEIPIENRIDVQPIISMLKSTASPDKDIVLIASSDPSYNYYGFHHRLTVLTGFDPTYPLWAGIDFTKRYLFIFNYDQSKQILEIIKKMESAFATIQKTKKLNAACTKQVTQFEHSYMLALLCQ